VADPARRPNVLERFFDGFNRWMDRATAGYVRGVEVMLASPVRWLAVFALACVGIFWLYTRLPGGFLPNEDQGSFFVAYMAAPGATMERTQQAVDQAEAFLHRQPQVRNVVTVIGFSIFGQGQTMAMSFVDLHPWARRRGADDSVEAMVRRANGAFFAI